MLVVGLTGGIASGKSEAAAAFGRLGVPLTDADVIARGLTAPGKPGYLQLLEALGPEVLDASGQLDRARLRRRLFADIGIRHAVEQILHPLILQHMRTALDGFDAAYAIAALPLLAENPQARGLTDRALVVDCPESLQLERLMARDGENADSARAILAAQTDRTRRRAAGDDILFNTGGLAELQRAVADLHGFYLDLARAAPPHHSARERVAARLDGKAF